jgi:hypothetical protein
MGIVKTLLIKKLNRKIMKTQIIAAINSLPHRVKPTHQTKSLMRHGDGLVQTHYEDHFDESVNTIKTNILSSDLPFSEKLELIGELQNHFPI